MPEQDHRAEIKAMDAHTKTSGCVVRCESAYKEGESHSHRWNAAEQARAEKDVYTIKEEPWRIVGWAMKKLRALAGEGGLVGAISKEGKKNVAKIKPFYRMFIPFPHNAHHIVPMGVLWNDVIDKAVNKAKKAPGDMFNLVIGGFLTEPYNHNDRPNMITLPTREKESKQLGLPIHLAKKARSHPVYSSKVASQVSAKVPPKYDSLAKALNEKKHPPNEATVHVKKILIDISEATYKAIMSMARSAKTAGKTLDETADEIAKQMVANLAK